MSSDETTTADDVVTGAVVDDVAVVGIDLSDVEADAYAYVHDGEYAVVWAATRDGDHAVSTRTFLAHDGEIREDPHAGDRMFGVDPEDDVREWAEQYAKSHPSAIAVARDWWDEWDSDGETDEAANE